MNITLAADRELIQTAQAYARARGTSLNSLVRDYMSRLTGEVDARRAAEEFAALARQYAGRSDLGYRFVRPGRSGPRRSA